MVPKRRVQEDKEAEDLCLNHLHWKDVLLSGALEIQQCLVVEKI